MKKSVLAPPSLAVFKRGTMSLPKELLPSLVDALLAEYRVVGPIVRDFSIALDYITSYSQLAAGYRDIQSPGRYQLEKTSEPGIFTYANGQESPKKFLHPGHLTMFKGKRDGIAGVTGDPDFDEAEDHGKPFAFFGIRPCDRQAILVLDKTFITDAPHVDSYYLRRRANSFVAVVNCTSPGLLCFCASMGSGPHAQTGFDLGITELPGSFLLEPGSPAGRHLLEMLSVKPATATELEKASQLFDYALRNMGRVLNTVGLPQILRDNLEHPHWDIMKDWCVGCTNCTMVCPTCFCYTIYDRVDLEAQGFDRGRVWDSCFSWQFTEVHGCNFRENLRQRYRHWACHKLGYWVEQYGVFGCVGCGRCISWCPVGIDIVDVAKTVRGGR